MKKDNWRSTTTTSVILLHMCFWMVFQFFISSTTNICLLCVTEPLWRENLMVLIIWFSSGLQHGRWKCSFRDPRTARDTDGGDEGEIRLLRPREPRVPGGSLQYWSCYVLAWSRNAVKAQPIGICGSAGKLRCYCCWRAVWWGISSIDRGIQPGHRNILFWPINGIKTQLLHDCGVGRWSSGCDWWVQWTWLINNRSV